MNKRTDRQVALAIAPSQSRPRTAAHAEQIVQLFNEGLKLICLTAAVGLMLLTLAALTGAGAGA